MSFFQKFRDFIASPSHSRTMGLLAMLILVSAVSLTVVLSQQHQTLKQRAASAKANCTVTFSFQEKIAGLGIIPPFATIDGGYNPMILARKETNDYTFTFDNVLPGNYQVFINGRSSEDDASWKTIPLDENQAVCPPAPTTCSSFSSSCEECLSLKPNSSGALNPSPCSWNNNSCGPATGTGNSCPSTSTPTNTCAANNGSCIPAEQCDGSGIPTSASDCDSNFGYTCCVYSANPAPVYGINDKGSCIDSTGTHTLGCKNNGIIYYTYNKDANLCNENVAPCLSGYNCTIASNGIPSCSPSVAQPPANPPLSCIGDLPICTGNLWSTSTCEATCPFGVKCKDNEIGGSIFCAGGKGPAAPAPPTKNQCETKCYTDCEGEIPGTTTNPNCTPDGLNACLAACSSSAPTPTTTPAPNNFIDLTLNVFQPRMIGKGIAENNNPKRKDIQITIILKSSTGQPINKSGKLDYTDGKYTGTIDLGAVPADTYTVLVKKGSFLKGFTSLSVPAASGSSLQLSVDVNLVIGLDDDKSLSPAPYYNALVGCFGSKMSKSSCTDLKEADITDDGVVDGIDYNIFIRSIKELSGK